MTREQFLVVFPEFSTSDPGRVDAVLAQAANSVSPSVFGRLYDQAHGHYAAHLLQSSAMGETSRMQWDTQQSVHWRNFVQVRRQCVIGLGVS